MKMSINVDDWHYYDFYIIHMFQLYVMNYILTLVVVVVVVVVVVFVLVGYIYSEEELQLWDA